MRRRENARVVAGWKPFERLQPLTRNELVLYFLSIVVSGLLSGAIYALIALAFVVVYKSSRMINFAVGEWVMFGSLLVAAGLHILALGLGFSIVLAEFGMIALAGAFSHLVLRRLAGAPTGFYHHDHTR